jgi:molybdate transport system ATP-binding protein
MATCLSVSLGKRFSKFNLSADYTFKRGITAVIGPSGAGKTTLIRLLAGLEVPDRGHIALGEEVWFDSESHTNIPVQKRQVGFVFNDYALFPQLTVWQNILYGAKDTNKALELLDILEIEVLKDRYPRQLSAGQQQRVAIARVLASNPRVLLMDEPFSAIDSYLKSQVYEEFLVL